MWTDRFELFVEHQYPVVNSPVQFITHVTNLETLHPRREGPVTFLIRGPSGENREHTVDEPARAGIYLPDLTFPKVGRWGLALRIPQDGEQYLVDLGTIDVYADEHAAMEAPDPKSFEGISFLKEQQWKILSETEPVERRPLTERLRLSGVVRPVPGKRALVTPPVEGRMMLAGNELPFLGDVVEEGQVLAVLQPVAASALQTLALELQVKEAEVLGQIREAQAALEKADLSLNRTRELYEKKAKSAREVEEAEFAQRQAAAELSAARSLMQSYEQAGSDLRTGQAKPSDSTGLPVLPLKAPINGGIVSVDVAEGEFVRPEKSLFTILDTSSVLIEARVPESDLQRIRPDLGASYALPGAPDQLMPVVDGAGGRFVLLSSEVDGVTRTAPVVYEAPNPDGHLRIGLALTVYVETDHTEDALVIPTSAIMEEEGRNAAYVQLSGETFERRDLELGIRSGDRVEVVAGLDENDRVVTKGAYAVRLASVSSVIPAHGHAH
ncbi:MAG: efflux RND transporter periplasmic adaptor subunit [Candidatus Hydrogenedentes bacterium]|nr:efflux RND transporter periplasmic adaptor subunit [Candidatus Hydrogenedentota bacterium]